MKSSKLAKQLSQKVMAIVGVWFAVSGCLSAFAQSGDASPNDPMSTVRSYVDAFNKADVETMVASCASPGFILDGMSPHVWQGPNATREWYRDGVAEAELLGVTEHLIVIGNPLHNDVTGKFAYVVAPASFSYKKGGKLIRQTGAYFTVALRQVKGRWLIASWAWTKGVTQ